MLDLARSLYDELMQKLEDLDQSQEAPANKPDFRLDCVRSAITHLREELKRGSFANEEEEIEFFKSVLPQFLSLFIYYSEKNDLECVLLMCTSESRISTIDRMFRKFEEFFKEHAEFLRYWRSGKINLDRIYFLRSGFMNQESLHGFLMDQSFCTIHSLRIAHFLAYIRLEQDLDVLVQSESDGVKANVPKGKRLEWTDSKAGLVELIYSLKEQGAFNHGKAELKTIIDYFELVFGVRIGNPTATFQQIMCRKNGSVSYLDKLRAKFMQRLDETV